MAGFEKPLFKAPKTVEFRAVKTTRWAWVFLSVLVILGGAFVASAALFIVAFASGGSEALSSFLERLPYALMLGFFAGGMVVARVSPGSTIREPAMAGAFAAAGMVILLGIAKPSQAILWLAIGVPAAILSAAGAALGELLQHGASRRRKEKP